MRHEVMMEMSLSELDLYAQACGIDVTGTPTKEGKVALIEERQGRVAEIHMFGLTLAVPVKRLHDKRVSDLFEDGRLHSDKDAATVMTLILGKEQYEKVIERCTDEDGIVDVEAIGRAFMTLVGDVELKNY